MYRSLQANSQKFKSDKFSDAISSIPFIYLIGLLAKQIAWKFYEAIFIFLNVLTSEILFS